MDPSTEVKVEQMKTTVNCKNYSRRPTLEPLTCFDFDTMHVEILHNFEISKLLVFQTCPKQVYCFVTFHLTQQ